MKKIRLRNYGGYRIYGEFYSKDMEFTGRAYVPALKKWFDTYRDAYNHIDNIPVKMEE